MRTGKEVKRTNQDSNQSLNEKLTYCLRKSRSPIWVSLCLWCRGALPIHNPEVACQVMASALSL